LQLNQLVKHSFVDQNAFEEMRKAETMVTAEQPSPVSVLDAAFYRDDPPSPVKKKPDISKYLGKQQRLNHGKSKFIYQFQVTCITSHTHVSIIKLIQRRILRYILVFIKFSAVGEAQSTDDDSEENSVDILQDIDWIEEKFIFNTTKHPDHKYITEILLASGLLSGHSSSQIFHSPGQLINPKLFYALEQVKTKRHFIEDNAKKVARFKKSEQMQRKLIFDVVNDILVQKLILVSSSALGCQPNGFAGTTPKGQQLLDELCTEIEQLQPKNGVSLGGEDENLKHQHAIWSNCCTEIPNIVLDIERLIFKDLITEVVRGEVASHSGTHCRQLVFLK